MNNPSSKRDHAQSEKKRKGSAAVTFSFDGKEDPISYYSFLQNDFFFSFVFICVRFEPFWLYSEWDCLSPYSFHFDIGFIIILTFFFKKKLLDRRLFLASKVDGKDILGPIGGWRAFLSYFQYFEDILGPFPLFT